MKESMEKRFCLNRKAGGHQPTACLLWAIITLLSFHASFGQNHREWGLQTRAKAGFLAAHRGVMGHLAQEHAYATEWSYIFRPSGKKAWHTAYKYPEMGVHFFYGSVGNTPILGNYIGAYGSISFPFIQKDHFRFSTRLGCGLGYTNKVYDPLTNRKNVAIASHLNALIEVGLDVTRYFGRNWITFGIDATHFSNGSFKVPNLGLNVPYVSLAYGRFLSLKNEVSSVEVVGNTFPLRKMIFGLTAIASVKDISPTGRDKKYGIYALSLSAQTYTRPKAGWELSVDFMLKQAIYGYRPEVKKDPYKVPQIGVYFGYLLPLDKFQFVVGMGIYVKDFYDPEGLFYHRLGMRYSFDNGILINLVIKSHWAKADYVEWGIGYRFWNRKNIQK